MSAKQIFVPRGVGQAEIVEKRSRFIGQVCKAESEQQAREFIELAKKQFHDARHHCWCFILKDGVVRYSDDGEPQGTAGQPMLSMFEHKQIENVCCVVTRYFGGVLLGTGGLVRAYTAAAKAALDDGGICVVEKLMRCQVTCTYAQYERIKLESTQFGAILDDTQFSDHVTLFVLLPPEQVPPYFAHIFNLSAGSVTGEELEICIREVPVESNLEA